MSRLLTLFSSLLWLVLHSSTLARLVAASGSAYFCSRDVYDSPSLQDCSHAIAAIPRVDQAYRYYVEPQLRVSPPAFNWQGWTDERPLPIRQRIIQVPKFWSYGSCNLALMSYVEGSYKKPVSFSRWTDIHLAGLTLGQVCVNLHSQGGAATVTDTSGHPALTIFLWRNAASFDTTMNQYMSAPIPAGIDPRNPAILKVFGATNSSGISINSTLPSGSVLGHSKY